LFTQGVDKVIYNYLPSKKFQSQIRKTDGERQQTFWKNFSIRVYPRYQLKHFVIGLLFTLLQQKQYVILFVKFVLSTYRNNKIS